MPLVNVVLNLVDHGQVKLPDGWQPRVWFRPNKSHIVPAGSGAMPAVEVQAAPRETSPSAYIAELWSEPNDPDWWYTLCVDWLPPGQASEQPGERSRGYMEWPYKIYPGEGGDLGDIISQQVGLALVYAAPNAPTSGRWNQIHWNTSTGWVYEREWTP